MSKPLGIEHWPQLPIFLPLTEETSCTVQKKKLTHHRATPTAADWDKMVRKGRYLKNRPRVQLWHKFQETPCQRNVLKHRLGSLQENTLQYRRRIQFWLSVSGSRIVRLCESVGRNNGTHIDVQGPRPAYERGGIGRCECSPRQWSSTRIG